MKFKYKGRNIDLPNDFIVKCGEHAESRGMTLEEYIAEAFQKLKRDETNKERKKAWNEAHQRKVAWNETETDKRMNVIGQNGNDGLHYDEVHDDCGTDECCEEC
tara:strand:- start:581 stop:892 length:312 start_codon:yes stop_codon:yes gene_type:complete